MSTHNICFVEKWRKLAQINTKYSLVLELSSSDNDISVSDKETS